MPHKVRYGVIGTGTAGYRHLQDLAANPHASVVAVAEKNADRAREVCARFKVSRIYTDYRQLLDQPDLDAVTIAVPNHLHAQMSTDALLARKHVLVESPMALTYKEACQMVDTAKKMKRTLMVAQPLRFHPQIQRARAILERGDLGAIFHARCFWLHRASVPPLGSWLLQKQLAGGGCLFDLGSHLLDACLHLLGDFQVASATGHTVSQAGGSEPRPPQRGRTTPPPPKLSNVEDFCAGFLRLRAKRTLSLEVSWSGPHPLGAREQGIDLLGTQAGLTVFPLLISRVVAGAVHSIEPAPEPLALPENQLDHLTSCLVEGKKPIVRLEESLQVQQVLEALYQSAAAGKELPIKS